MQLKSQKIGIGTGLGWIFGIMFIMGGLTDLVDETVFGITAILLGLYLLPPITKKIAEHTKINLSGWRKLGGFFAGLVAMIFIAAIFSTAEDLVTNEPQAVAEPNVDIQEAKPVKSTEIKPVETAQAEEVSETVVEVSPEPVEAAEVEEEPTPVVDAELIERLNREIASIDEGVDYTGFYNDGLGIQMGVALFGTWAMMVEEGEQSQNPEAQALAKKLRQKVSQFQVVQFPKLRQAYGKAVREQVWEHNVEVDVYGNANGIIQFTGYVFADNGNKKMIQETVSDMLRLLRFDQSRFKWYKGDDEYTYFELNTELDSKVMIIK